MSAAPISQLPPPATPPTLRAVADVSRPAPPVAAHALPFPPRLRRWSREEYYQMADLGWFRGKRVLLLAGEIIEMAGQGNWHSVTIGKGLDALRPAFPPERFWSRPQLPLDLPDGSSEPEPDICVVPGRPDDYRAHPSTALLIIEVADTSLALDRRKANAYAMAGVADYWIASLKNHELEVYRDPIPDAAADFGFRYGSTATLRPGDFVTPLAAPDANITVADLLPAQPVGDGF